MARGSQKRTLMSTRISVSELHNAAVALRADEAVAVVQQLMHSVSSDSAAHEDEPFGPPTLQNVYLDEDGFVICQACQTTPAVAEMAIFLQQLLPESTPRVPGALRYTIARALHDVDAPPFDSIQDFSAALERFESGDRVAVVRAVVERATALCLDRFRGARDDRRRLMPSSSDFRRELRAADARYYELATASGRIVAAEPPLPERRRTPSLAMGIVAGVCLVFVGEVMHTRSTSPAVAPSAPAPLIQQALDIADVAPPPADAALEDVSPPPSRRAIRVVAPVATASLGTDRSSKSGVKRATRRPAKSTSAGPHKVKDRQGVMDKLHLGWLRNAFVAKKEPL